MALEVERIDGDISFTEASREKISDHTIHFSDRILQLLKLISFIKVSGTLPQNHGGFKVSKFEECVEHGILLEDAYENVGGDGSVLKVECLIRKPKDGENTSILHIAGYSIDHVLDIRFILHDAKSGKSVKFDYLEGDDHGVSLIAEMGLLSNIHNKLRNLGKREFGKELALDDYNTAVILQSDRLIKAFKKGGYEF